MLAGFAALKRMPGSFDKSDAHYVKSIADRLRRHARREVRMKGKRPLHGISNLRFQTRMLLMWLPATLAMVVCFILLQNYLQLGAYEQNLKTNQHNISSLKKVVNDAAENVAESVNTIANSPGVYEYLFVQGGQNAQLLQKISQTLFQTALNNRFIFSIGIIKNPDDWIVRNPYSSSVKAEDIRYFYYAAASLQEAAFVDIFTSGIGYLTVYIAPLRLDTGASACMFAVVNQGMVAKSLHNFNNGVNRYYMFSNSGKMLFGSDYEPPQDLDTLLFADQDENRLIRYGDSYFMRESQLTPHWILLMETSQIAPYRNLERIMRLAMVFCAVLGIATLLEYLFISNSYNARIHELNEFSQRIIDGDLDSRFEAHYTDEISRLGNSLNKMVDRMAVQIEKITMQKYAIQNARFFALQNQMNPHFINNTLESIRMTATTNNDRPVAELVTQLAYLIRYSTQKSDGYATVSEEIEHMNAYLKLQKSKLKERLLISINVAPEISDEVMLRFLLQPLVENAIYHGIEPKRGVSTLSITGERIDGGIRFTISDDGVGMSEEKLAQVHRLLQNEQLAEEEYKISTTGIGLSNVNARLRILFGATNVIQVTSAPKKGTTVVVTIPKGGGVREDRSHR